MHKLSIFVITILHQVPKIYRTKRQHRVKIHSKLTTDHAL